MPGKHSPFWFYPIPDEGDVPVLDNQYRLSTMLSQIVMTHIGLIYAWMTYVPFPCDPVNAGIISVILQLVLWSDTTPGDVLSRADRAATRKFISNCLCFVYLVLFTINAYDALTRMMGIMTLFSSMFIGVVLNTEILEYQCLMCRLREHSRRCDCDSVPHTDIESPADKSGLKGDIEAPAYEKLEENSTRATPSHV